jgi:NAD-dependent oxidoreductase involved in siderophore biosynthesis
VGTLNGGVGGLDTHFVGLRADMAGLDRHFRALRGTLAPIQGALAGVGKLGVKIRGS